MNYLEAHHLDLDFYDRFFEPGACPRAHAEHMERWQGRSREGPTFSLDMTAEEREIMDRHAVYWQPYIDSGRMVVFGPVLDATEAWGLGVVEAEDEDELRAFAAGDPAVVSGTVQLEFGKMLTGFVRMR